MSRKARRGIADLALLLLVVYAVCQLIWWDQLDRRPLFVDHGAHLESASSKRPGDTFWIVRDYEQHATPIYCNRSLVDHGVIPLPNHGAATEQGRVSARFPVALPDWMPAGDWIYRVECVFARNPLKDHEAVTLSDVRFHVDGRGR